jgi:hypothetical protein
MSVLSTGLSRHELHGARPLTITIQTAKALSGLGFTTLWRLIKEKRLRVVKVDGRTLVVFRSFEELLTPPASDEAAAQERSAAARGRRAKRRKVKRDTARPYTTQSKGDSCGA